MICFLQWRAMALRLCLRGVCVFSRFFRQEIKRPRRRPDSRRVWALAVVQHPTDVIAAPVA